MRHHTQLPSSLAACVLEAIIAAVYMDSNYERCREVLEPMLEPHIDRAARSGHQQNFKSVLQQHAQQNLDLTPCYRILDEQGPDHAKCFKVAVELGTQRFPESWGQSKKQAEQQAALNALHELGIVEQDGNGEIRVVVEEVRDSA
jgi:ribonuclease-3